MSKELSIGAVVSSGGSTIIAAYEIFNAVLS